MTDPMTCVHCGYFIDYQRPKAPAEPEWVHTPYRPDPPTGPPCDRAEPKREDVVGLRTASVSDLTEFLLARIAEDEAVLNDAAARFSPTSGTELSTFLGDWGDDERWIIDYPLGRALAECEAKRRIVELDADPSCDLPTEVLLLLALPYADHPDYREEWRP